MWFGRYLRRESGHAGRLPTAWPRRESPAHGEPQRPPAPHHQGFASHFGGIRSLHASQNILTWLIRSELLHSGEHMRRPRAVPPAFRAEAVARLCRIRRLADGGQGWIRTSVRSRGQIYSLLPLTTRPPVQRRHRDGGGASLAKEGGAVNVALALPVIQPQGHLVNLPLFGPDATRHLPS